MFKKKERQEIAAIFDLDGTLLDTLPSIVAAVNETMDIMGMPPFDEDTVRSFVGMGWRVLVDRMMAARHVKDEATIKRAISIYNEVFPRLSTHHVTPFPGIRELLESLKEEGLKLGVMTNKGDELTPGVIRTAFPDDLFDIVRGARRFVPLKPDPTSTIRLLKELGADPAQSFFIGDSDIDILTGRGAGMRTIGVTWGFRDASELSALSPDLLAGDASEVLSFILRMIRT